MKGETLSRLRANPRQLPKFLYEARERTRKLPHQCSESFWGSVAAWPCGSLALSPWGVNAKLPLTARGNMAPAAS